MKQNKKSKQYNSNLGLKELLEEADKITLDDLDFNKILKEQSSILCNIQKMLHYENNKNNKEPFKCNIMNLKNDANLKKIINEYKNNNIVNTNKYLVPKQISKSRKKSKVQSRTKSKAQSKTKPKMKPKTIKLKYTNGSNNNKFNNNSKYFNISGTIKLKKHQS
jgi:hypothetical protein